jgi:stage IV sporulation protein FB
LRIENAIRNPKSVIRNRSLMLLGEPAPTQGDIHFRLFGIPVRVHPFFWLVAVFLGAGGMSRGEVDPVNALVWVVVMFVSILVHEFGHATMQRSYGGHPWITLYGLGGLASCNDCDRSTSRQIIISLAGPIAGFLLAIVMILVMRFTGHGIGFSLSRDGIDLETLGLPRVLQGRLGPLWVYFQPFQSDLLNVIIWDSLQVNILWGLVNLLPIYPLDGGRVSRELFTLRHPRVGIIQSLQLSVGVAALVAIYGILQQSMFMCLMFGYLAYSSFQVLQAYRQQ